MLDHTELLGHVWGAYSRVRVKSAGTPPSMPRTASLSQHALATSPSRRALGPLLNYYLVYILLPTAFSYSLSLSLSLLYYFPKYLSLGQNIIFEAGVHLKKNKLLVIQPVKLI